MKASFGICGLIIAVIGMTLPGFSQIFCAILAGALFVGMAVLEAAERFAPPAMTPAE